MRRLDLTRYGKFTNLSIDFGELTDGASDLHVIYGPNEAGKSTVFAAFLDLLFGIGSQSPFNFLHSYATMHIGADLDIGGETRRFARLKRPQNSLIDGQDRSIPEAVIRGDLGGIERDSYRTMFSLDDDTLEKGGESILASKGDLGQLLFSATAGLSQLSDKLDDLTANAESFYKYRARSGGLAELKARLAELKAEREQFDTLATDHARLVDTRDRAAIQYDEAIKQRGDTQRRMNDIRRYLAALPRLSALRDIRARLAPLAEIPEAPQGWAAEVPELQRNEIERGVKTKAVAEEIDQLSSQMRTIIVNESALRVAERVDQLADLRARYVTAEKDIPERRLQLRELDVVMSGILNRVERPQEVEPKRLVLGAVTVGRLRDLIEARSGIDAAIRTAAVELAEAQRRLDETAAKLPRNVVNPQSWSDREQMFAELAAVVEALRSADHDVRRRHAERTRSAAIDVLDDRFAELQPWQGTGDELVAMDCPSTETLQNWKARRSEAESTRAQSSAEVERLITALRRCKAEQASLASTTGVVSDYEAAEIRAQREHAWAAHRRALDVASADKFEAVLRHDDIVTAGRLSHVGELARLHQYGQALAVAQADLDRAVELAQQADATLAAIDDEIAAGSERIASYFPGALSLTQLESWLARRGKALEARLAVQAAERDIRAAEKDAAVAAERLASAMTSAGVSSGPEARFDAMFAKAQTLLEREAELRRLRDELDARSRDVALRKRAAEQATLEDQAWAEAWAKTCRGCWLGQAPEIPTVGAVREVLSAISELSLTIEKRAALQDRIEKMVRDQLAFHDEVGALARLLRIEAGSDPVLALGQRIGEEVRNAAADRDRLADLMQQDKSVKERQRKLAEIEAVHDEHKRRMTAFFAVTSLEEVGQKLSAAEGRAELMAQERDIIEALRASDVIAAEATLDLANRPALEAELAELTAQAEDQDKRCHELYAAKSAAEDRVEAIGGDAKVALIEERRRTTLLEIEDGALRYLQLRAGIVATQQALATYRERHRSSMMARASEAFRTISRGAYTGLVAQPGKDGDTLIALSAEGGSKAADKLSKGTRFQLYLALRVAGYHEFVRSRTSVPFVADDIMETFDDFRAEEAFRLFAEMAQAGQVIYLTHHQHLCDIVQRVCPAARLHRLDGEDMPINVA